MPFFIRGKGKNVNKTKAQKDLKKKSAVNGLPKSKRIRTQEPANDEEITSDEEEFVNKTSKDIEETPYKIIDDESPQEKKVRLAKQYLEEIKKQKEEEIEDEDEDEIHKAVGLKLKEDVLEAAGMLQRSVADALEVPGLDLIKFLKSKHHKLSLTCLVVSHDEKHIYSASKDASIVKWGVNGEKLGYIPSIHRRKNCSVGHSHCVLSIAASSDGLFLATGDSNGTIQIWDAVNLSHLKTFKKHRGPVSGLVFRKGTNTLYSSSHDRLVMAWNLDEMAFMETLGGHQDAITGIDALIRESCITSGGRDESVIVYVIPEEKQLRFTASQNSIDGVKLVNEKTFVTFGQDGSVALWSTLKKKPHFIGKASHGFDPESGAAHWLTAAAALTNTDVVATGSMDGYIRLWKIVHHHRRLESLFSIPVSGVVNGLDFTASGSHLVAAVGQEHKLGRWFCQKEAKNVLVIIPLNKKS